MSSERRDLLVGLGILLPVKSRPAVPSAGARKKQRYFLVGGAVVPCEYTFDGRAIAKLGRDYKVFAGGLFALKNLAVSVIVGGNIHQRLGIVRAGSIVRHSAIQSKSGSFEAWLSDATPIELPKGCPDWCAHGEAQRIAAGKPSGLTLGR